MLLKKSWRSNLTPLVILCISVSSPICAFPTFIFSSKPLEQVPLGSTISNNYEFQHSSKPFQLCEQELPSAPKSNPESYSSLEDSDFDTWLAWQSNQSFSLMLENIGGLSTNIPKDEISHGAVIASQSRIRPNYFFQWIRDSALTIRSLIHQLADTQESTASAIRSTIESYIELNFHIQRQPNRSGWFDDERRSGLGEPKFMPDGQPFNENWGRPQADGPALRVSTIVNYLDHLEMSGNSIQNSLLGNASNVYHNIIKPDLEYVMRNWRYDSFDLWEEVRSVHFFNALIQLKSLSDGLRVAKSMDQSRSFLASLESHFTELKDYILNIDTGFISYQVPYIVETPSLFRQRRRSGLDAATLLASIHTHNEEVNSNDVPFDVDDSHILNTISAMVTDMKFRYPVNHNYLGKSKLFGVGLGRYPEDVYDGYTTTEGNPWFICTCSAAEVLYKLVYKRIKEKSDITISAETRELYSLFVDGLFDESLSEDTLRLEYGSDSFKQTLKNIFAYSDTFLEVVRDHIDFRGHMSEQFNRNTGYMQGAEDLTWSYSSFYNSACWRKKASSMVSRLTS